MVLTSEVLTHVDELTHNAQAVISGSDFLAAEPTNIHDDCFEPTNIFTTHSDFELNEIRYKHCLTSPARVARATSSDSAHNEFDIVNYDSRYHSSNGNYVIPSCTIHSIAQIWEPNQRTTSSNIFITFTKRKLHSNPEYRKALNALGHIS